MKSFSIQWRRVGILIGVGILVLVIVDLNARIEGLKRLNKEADTVRAQATQSMQTQMALQTQIAYANSDAAVEDYARPEGHMIQEGDIPVVPLGNANATATPQVTPPPASTPMSNWEIWWMLFFGE
ncbi:MAG: hypothetical protein HFACDABA_01652 [Anaerolineales bacterium]|nr:hypothetical protein [Anaerolineales bacterium]